MTRQEAIHSKGFEMGGTTYGKVKIGTKSLEDAVLNLGSIQKETKNSINKAVIYRALADNDMEKLREISNYFYKTSGIYQRVCNYFATMYRYDWYVVPEVYDNKSVKEDKIVGDFHKVLTYLDNSYVKKVCGDMALGVIKNGAYYGYIVPTSSGIVIQELPVNYCRSRYNVGNLPAVEFNMRFFDVMFPDTNYRMQVLNLFPDEFKKGYLLYKQGKLVSDNTTVHDCHLNGWYLLDINSTIKFNLNNFKMALSQIEEFFENGMNILLEINLEKENNRKTKKIPCICFVKFML